MFSHRRKLISPFAFAVAFSKQLLSCGDQEPSSSELATCAGAPATAPIDNFAANGEPDSLTRAASEVISQALTPDELAYLSKLDRGKLTGSNLFTDPVMLKAILSIQPLIKSDSCAQPDDGLHMGVPTAAGPRDSGTAKGSIAVDRRQHRAIQPPCYQQTL